MCRARTQLLCVRVVGLRGGRCPAFLLGFGEGGEQEDVMNVMLGVCRFVWCSGESGGRLSARLLSGQQVSYNRAWWHGQRT